MAMRSGRPARMAGFFYFDFSPVFGGLAVLIDVTLLRSTETKEAYEFPWISTTVLWIVDIALYGWGVSGLVQHLLKLKQGEQRRSSHLRKRL